MDNQVYLESLGCSKNRVDSEIMMGTLAANAFQIVTSPKDADVIVVNTCGFLTAAVNESIDRILELANEKKTGRCKKLIVAGCMSERYKDSILQEMPEVDGLIGAGDYTQILPCIKNALLQEERISYLQQKPDYLIKNFESERILSTDKHYAFLKISEGCSNLCSFCNIPKLRGKMRSRNIPHIVNEFKQMLSWGIKEINIISQDSSSYGRDLPRKHNLLDLVNSLLEASKDECWLRIFYSYPNTYPREIFDRMAQFEQLVPYCDMPFQHISDLVLKVMRRNITRSEIQGTIEYALSKVPDISFRTTFIVGFPTETDKNFEELLDFVKQGYFQHVGVFTYSHEDNILSSRYGDPIPDAIKQERRKILMEAQQEVLRKKNQELVGQKMRVLIEGESEETDLLLKARTKYQSVDVDGHVLINEGNALAGTFHDIEVIEAHPYDLVGKILEN